MTALETLADLGFQNNAVVSTRKGIQTLRIRTSKGWTYERFPEGEAEANVRAWAVAHEPEP